MVDQLAVTVLKPQEGYFGAFIEGDEYFRVLIRLRKHGGLIFDESRVRVELDTVGGRNGRIDGLGGLDAVAADIPLRAVIFHVCP